MEKENGIFKDFRGGMFTVDFKAEMNAKRFILACVANGGNLNAKRKLLWQVCLKLPFSEGQYDLATMLQETAKTTYVHSIKGIKKALVVAKEDSLLLRTEGVNIQVSAPAVGLTGN